MGGYATNRFVSFYIYTPYANPITKRFSISKAKAGANGSPGAAGTRGSRTFYVSGYTAWADAAATTAASVSGGPVINDVVTEYGTNFSATKFWDGASWITVTAAIDGNLLVSGTVGANKLSVTNLSAVSASIGTLRTATTGARMEIMDNVIKVYDASNVLRVKLGNLSL